MAETWYEIITYFVSDGFDTSAHVNHLIINARVIIYATIVSFSVLII